MKWLSAEGQIIEPFLARASPYDGQIAAFLSAFPEEASVTPVFPNPRKLI